MKLKFKRQPIFLSCVTLLFLLASSMAKNGAIALPGSSSNLPSFNAIPIAQAANESAREIFQQAYENRYTWDENFPGYVAEISVQNGETTHQGIVRVDPDFNVSVSGIDDEEARQFAQIQMQMEINHRRQLDFERVHGANQFELNGEDENGGALIQVNEPNTIAYYIIKNNQILQVNRTMGEIAFTVNVLGAMETGEGYLTNHFQTIYKNAETGEVLEQEDMQDTHEKVGNYYLLKRREVRWDKVNNPEEKATPDTIVELNNFQPFSAN